MEFSTVAVERAMTYQQVIMRALAGTWTWLKAADVRGIQPRSLRRWRARYDQDPVLGLLDRRRRRPSHRTAPRAEVQRILRLYRLRYQGVQRPPLPPHRPARARRDTLVYVREACPPGGGPGAQGARPRPPPPASRAPRLRRRAPPPRRQ
jgi:hypothetical protein